MKNKKESSIYSVLSDSLKSIREATHPLSKLVRKLRRARGINEYSWDKLVREYIKNDPTILAKNPDKADLSQCRNRLNKHLDNPSNMSFTTFMKFARVIKATRIRFAVILEWEDNDGNIMDRASAEVTELVITKYDSDEDEER